MLDAAPAEPVLIDETPVGVQTTGQGAGDADGSPQEPESAPAPDHPETLNTLEIATTRGAEAAEKGMRRSAIPGEYREEGLEPERDAWLAGFDAARARRAASEEPASA